jgi:hypothetical protein
VAKIVTGLHVTFDENGNPQTVKLEQLNTDPTGQATAQECYYTLVAADITGVNAVITNAQAFCGI